jgi:hypothetical protein
LRVSRSLKAWNEMAEPARSTIMIMVRHPSTAYQQITVLWPRAQKRAAFLAFLPTSSIFQ